MDRLGDDVTVSSRFLRLFNQDKSSRRGDKNAEQGVGYNVDAVAAVQIETFDPEPYYFAADEVAGYRNNHQLSAGIQEKGRPTIKGLVKACTEPRDSDFVLFQQGMWVEYRSNDMQWKVGVVNRVIKQTPDSWDFEERGEPAENEMLVYYNVGIEGLLDESQIRAPAKGLQYIFGMRPWLWQQFTLLQIEKRIRFDEDHEFDFDEIDCHEFAADRFDLWLKDPRNIDFKQHYDEQSEMTQSLLRDHLLTPFDLMDQITENAKEWDFDDEDISVYTYLGVLGSGIPVVILALMIQLLSPMILFYNSMITSDGGPNDRFDVDGTNEEDPVPLNGNFLPTTNFDQFCNTNLPREEGKAMIIVVLLVYVATVVPDSLLSFFRTSGGANSTYSKINSLRQIIWDQNDDTVTQQIGFKLDRLMNTGYVVLLYMLMLFILLQTPIVLDLILNALAIDFIYEIDEKIANSDWWDEDNRWIKAGTIELVIQSTLRLRVLESRKKICKLFDIDPKEYKDVLGNVGLKNHKVARQDDRNQRYMTKKERVYTNVAEDARNKNKFTFNEYNKAKVQFGYSSSFWDFVGLKTDGLFHKYTEFRTWSRWEKILFLPRVQNLEDEKKSERLNNGRAVTVRIGQTDLSEFREHILLVLTGVDTLSTMTQAFKHGYYMQLPVKFLLGIFEIFFYILQLMFPVFVAFAIFFVPYCY